MAKPLGIIAFLAVLVIMAVLLVLYGHILGVGAKKNAVTTTLHSTTTVPKQNSTSTYQQTTTTVYNTGGYDCISNYSTVEIFNGDFGFGTYEGWNTTGPGFGSAPLNITYADNHSGYYSAPWSNYEGGYFATTYHGGLALQPGNITSMPFLVTEPYLNFKIISPANNQIYVQLLEDGKPIDTIRYNTLGGQGINSSSEFANASIPLIGVLCKNVSIRVVSGVVGTISTEYEIVAVGDFRLSKTPLQTAGIIVNQTV